MAEIETSDDFGARLCARVWNAMAGDLAVNEVYAMAGKLIEADRSAVANAVLDELEAAACEYYDECGYSDRDAFRRAIAESRAKCAPKVTT